MANQPATQAQGRRATLTVTTLAMMTLAGATLAGVGCGVNDESKLPPEVPGTDVTNTPSGALARYRGALAALPAAFDEVLFTGGLLTDELAALPLSFGESGPYTGLDSRQSPTFSPARLHRLRGEARDARGFLRTYAPDSSPALQGHLYALEGYAEIFLADLFCSGIPLSTVDFDGNYTLAAGSTTAEVYNHALELFDSALALSSDNVDVQHLAALGRGRALLARERYAEAAAAVVGVPTGYRYQIGFAFDPPQPGNQPDSAALWWYATQSLPGAPGMADREGENGLAYRSSADPRTAAQAMGEVGLDTLFFPQKYTPSSPITLTMASGIEARLIEAEAALQADDDGQWRAKLNALRQDQAAWSTIVPQVFAPLDTLADPGADGAGIDPRRVDLLFQERAFWLYLSGYRQGDLRRLIRQYPPRAPGSVYPTGDYPGGVTRSYGEATVIEMPAVEQQLNPRYAGCINTNA